MGYKRSIFNFRYKRRQNENVVYNTFSKALVVLDDYEVEQFESDDYSNQELCSQLLENGILVNDTEDEISFLKYFHYKTKFEGKLMFLTIAPTMDCNFACPYCYENRRNGIMSKDVQKALIGYISDTVESGIEGLNITWYGGEPLLCFDVVEYISQSVFEICQKNGCKLKMDMVTNGYLLSEEIVNKLDLLGISKIQITIDGLREHHNKSRPLRGGGETFDRIIENLRLFDDSPISVLVRMNVDNNNADDFIQLKKIIDGFHNNNIRVYASPVEDINQDSINKVSNFMSNEEFEAFAVKACGEGAWSDDDFSVMDDRFCFCTSETENCYVVDDLGHFYKCWNEVGRTEYSCFNVLDSDNKNYHQIASFVANDPFSDEKCSKCVFLPLCFGGCKFQKAHLNKSVCGFSDASIKKYIETTFFK